MNGLADCQQYRPDRAAADPGADHPWAATWAATGLYGDILGGGFMLSLAGFLVATAALESGGPYPQLGSSRAKMFSAITEPVVLFVVFTVALLTGTDLPYALAATVRSCETSSTRPLRVSPAISAHFCVSTQMIVKLRMSSSASLGKADGETVPRCARSWTACMRLGDPC